MPLDVYISTEHIFVLERVKGDTYCIRRDDEVAYDAISMTQGAKYMRALRIIYK